MTIFSGAATMLIAAAATVAPAAQAVAYSMPMSGAGARPAVRVVRVSDDAQRPPTTPGEAPVSRDRAQRDQAVMELKRRFNAAADPVTHRMSLAEARRTGWTAVADHFSEIDASGSGSVGFDDVAHYLRARRHPAFVGQ